ncbi:MAG: hypothetical protein HYS74_01625 [Parcubacteria group bacterium]|nr:hypothetical protein [Parcubacteria group bacterium]
MLKDILKKTVVFILTLEARAVLKKYKPRIVAVTGSVGKTSGKDAIRAVLEPHFFVRASAKSYNSEIGVPLSILGSENGWENPFAWFAVFCEGLALIFLKNHYPSWLVLEVGADRPGDIQAFTRWIAPDVVVITRFGEAPVHVEFFDSRDALVREKSHLAHAVKADGVLVLNADDPDVARLRESIHGRRLVAYGMSEGANVRGSHAEVRFEDGEPVGMQAKVAYDGNVFPLVMRGTLGMPILEAALAALAVGSALGVNLVSALPALAAFRAPPGRMRLIKGLKGSVIIDDSYNSSPAAARAALEALAELQVTGRKIAALGDMLELGKESVSEHKKIGALAATACDVLVTVGVRAQIMEDAAHAKRMKKGAAFHFDTAFEAGEFLAGFVGEGDAVLVKGSQSIRMERVVKKIMAEPERAGEFLVRQEPEWRRR